jgi:hypothetical protein
VSPGCSAEQIAAIMEIVRHTIERRFAPAIKKGREHG